jgi:hypothetical protein
MYVKSYRPQPHPHCPTENTPVIVRPTEYASKRLTLSLQIISRLQWTFSGL